MSMRYPGGLIATSPVNARYPSGVWTQAQAAPYQAQNVWTRDQFWPNTTLLLQGDGATNGAQNNTFLDSSTNNFTITRNGNTTQGSFTPYEANGYWSNYFDGSSILTFASSTNYVPGAGQFCLECWFFPTTTSGDRWLIGNRNGNFVPFGINYPATTYPGTLLFYISSNGSSWDVVNGTTVSGVNANQWNHFALVRNSSNQFIVYINGVGTTIATNAANFTSAQPFYVGGSPSGGDADFIGYISNTRFVKGDSVYSGNFTPSTAPLTAIANTQLLTSQSNRFIDNSTNAVTPTLTGTPSVQAFQPFPGQTTYSTSVLGGSGYFDGTGDTLTTSTTQIIPTGSFTVECWAYVTGSGSNQKFVSQGSSGTAGRFSVGIEGGNWFTQIAGALIQTGTPVRSQWNYIAVTYNGSTLTMYVNGSSIGTASTSGNVQNSGLTIGQDWNSYITTGYIAEVRISNTVRTITTPTAPFTSDGNTSFLCSFTNAGISDAAMMNDLETVGNAQVSTSVVKYGTGSMAFDGSGDYLRAPSSVNWDFGTGDFTIEAWCYFSSIVYMSLAGKWSSGGYAWIVQFRAGDISSGNGIRFYTGNNGSLSSNYDFSWTPSTATWYHLALTRSGSSLRLFINGTQQGSTATIGSQVLSSTNGVCTVGASGDGFDQNWNGYIDDLRITKGAARYLTTFTPPPARMPGQ